MTKKNKDKQEASLTQQTLYDNVDSDSAHFNERGPFVPGTWSVKSERGPNRCDDLSPSTA